MKDAKEDIEIMNKKFEGNFYNHNLTNFFLECVAQFNKCSELFGEDPKKINPEELFGIINNFIELIKVISFFFNFF